MSEKPINPLRERMLEDMSVRRFVPSRAWIWARRGTEVRPPGLERRP
jgi:hypothetical protein